MASIAMQTQKEIALCQAARQGNCEEIGSLLKNGAKINVPEKDGRSVLHLAAQNGHSAAISVLLNFGANIQAQTNSGKNTPLHYAAGAGNVEGAEILLSYGANLEAKNIYQETPLSFCDQILKIARRKRTFNQEHNKYLFAIAQKKYNRIVAFLLSRGAIQRDKKFSDEIIKAAQIFAQNFGEEKGETLSSMIQQIQKSTPLCKTTSCIATSYLYDFPVEFPKTSHTLLTLQTYASIRAPFLSRGPKEQKYSPHKGNHHQGRIP